MSEVAKREAEIAGLYQVPLGEFTAARNQLAKRLGAAGESVRALEKPTAAAWAVNQLFWQKRHIYDALIRAAQLMRTAHANVLSGRKADVADAEASHREAIRAATTAIRDVAAAIGETLSGSTMEAIAETLQALPSNEPAGRLTKPLKPLGFGALMSMGVQVIPGISGAGRSKPTAAERAAAKKQDAERAKHHKALQKALRAAEAAEHEAESALVEARKAVAKVERDYAAVRDRLQFLEKQRSDAEQEAHKRARALQDAANARLQAAQDVARAST